MSILSFDFHCMMSLALKKKLIQLLQTSKVTGTYASNIENFRHPYHSTVTSTVPSGLLSPASAVQIPAASLETINSGNQVANLFKPSAFLAPTSTSLLIPPISSPVIPSAPVQHSLNLPRQYGTPLLQPFPPPNPPSSLTPISSSTPNKPVISRDKVRDALLSLVQVLHGFTIFVLFPSLLDY